MSGFSKNIPVDLIIPCEIKSIWKSQPQDQRNIIHLDTHFDLAMLSQCLPLGSNEMSGTFGFNWISWEEGLPESSPASQTSHFSWHYHPDNDPRFSYKDWRTFIYSASPVSILVTKSQSNLYIKKNDYAWENIKKWLQDETGKPGRNKILSYMRFCKIFNSVINASDIYTTSEIKICNMVGVSLHEVRVDE